MISTVCRLSFCLCMWLHQGVSLCVCKSMTTSACWTNGLVLTLAANSRGPYSAASASTSRGHLPSQQAASHLFSHPPSSSSFQLSGHRVKYIRPLLTDTDVALQNWWQPFYSWFPTHTRTHLVGRLRMWCWKRLSSVVSDTVLHLGDTNRHALLSLIVCPPPSAFWCAPR